MDETLLKYSYLLIDVEVPMRWLGDQGITIDEEQAEKIIDYIYQDVIDSAYDLVMCAYEDLKED